MHGVDKKSATDLSENECATSARRRKNKVLLDDRNYSLNELSKLIERIAETDSNIFLLGDSSASNEVVSRAIHALSARSKCSFSSVDCRQYSSEILDGHLFGIEKGAFSSAGKLQKGQLEGCNNGTVLLNNIDELNSALQDKLLQVIRTGEIQRVGSSSQIKLNIRIISSAQKDFADKIESEAFDVNLFKSLNQSTISMPPLRRSSEDIPALIFALTKNIKHAKDEGYIISEDAIKILSENTWYGSAGELSKFLEKLSILYPLAGAGENRDIRSVGNQSSLRAGKLDEKVSGMEQAAPPRRSGNLPESGVDLKKQMADIEVQYIREALELSDGVVAQAAKLLGLRRTTLVEKLRKYGIRR